MPLPDPPMNRHAQLPSGIDASFLNALEYCEEDGDFKVLRFSAVWIEEPGPHERREQYKREYREFLRLEE